MTSGTCNSSDCTNITGQELTQVGSTCQWTAADSPWNHELVCESGVWYYRVWNGAIGSGTLCAEWTHQETVTDCPPLGSEADGIWEKTDGDCVPSTFGTYKDCPMDCSDCSTNYCVDFIDSGGIPISSTTSRVFCDWLATGAAIECATIDGVDQWKLTINTDTVYVAPASACPPTGAENWTMHIDNGATLTDIQTGSC